TSGRDEIASAAFQRFMRDHAATLSPFFSEAERQAMRDIAADLHRANRSITSGKLPGGSNTAQDTAAMARLPSGSGQSILRYLAHVAGASGAASVFVDGGFTAAAAALGAGLVNRFRDAGI